MGGHRGGEDDKDQPGHGIFAYRTKDDKTWRMHMTMSSVLRTTLEGYSAREWIIMPLVLLSIAGMGILYSLLPDDMTKRVIPAEVLEIYESPRMEFELGELKEADAVIKAANEGFTTALEEGGTRHWFVRQLLMALDPANEKLTFWNNWHIQEAKGRYLVDVPLEGKVVPTPEKSGKDFVLPSDFRETYPVLALEFHNADKLYHCVESKASCTDSWDTGLNLGRRFCQPGLLSHLIKYGGVRQGTDYKPGDDLKPRPTTYFAATGALLEEMQSREPASSTQKIVRVAPKFTRFAAMAHGARRRRSPFLRGSERVPTQEKVLCAFGG